MALTLDTYLVTQEVLSAGRSTDSVVEDAIAGGIDIVQVREKHRSARTQLEVAQQLREATAAADVPLIINDRVDIALAADADGVHLGDDDLPISVARDQLGDEALIGRSVSTVEAAREAEDAGADYLGVGALYHTGSKNVDDDENEIGLEIVNKIADVVDIPFVGIGGVTPERAPDVVEAGADGVAVITAITGADDPERATRDLKTAVEQGKSRRDELGGEA